MEPSAADVLDLKSRHVSIQLNGVWPKTPRRRRETLGRCTNGEDQRKEKEKYIKEKETERKKKKSWTGE